MTGEGKKVKYGGKKKKNKKENGANVNLLNIHRTHYRSINRASFL